MSNKINSHKDLIVWKKSIELVKEVYEISKDFPKEELYGLISQLRRSAISIPSNIAEGSGRKSSKELQKFLYISQGSVAELETQLIIARELGYIENLKIVNKIVEIRKMLSALITSLKEAD